MERRIVKEKYVTYSEARRLLEDRVREKEFGVIITVDKTLGYLRVFGDKDPDKARGAVEKLVGLGLDEDVAVNIVNICPSDPGEVRSILSMKKEFVYDESLIEGILEAIREYCESSYPEE
ncbi:MAG: RNA polymerase Rpb4 family protein [Desulfurococcales archaeon]|nr:RNA polymerase Rpb4 family protein [Desulfurococcales archaeon]